MSERQDRHAFVDYAKGICIVLVVLMHTTLGVEKAAGAASWLHGFIDWARPFRMPDFFFISGLFLASRIERPWREFLDGKFLHFGYFYLLWMSVQVLARSYGLARDGGAMAVLQAWLAGLVEPFGALWFIYMLAIFFVVIKLLRRAPPLLVFAGAAMLQMSGVETGWLAVDEFAARFVYIFAGFQLAPLVFAAARALAPKPQPLVIAALLAWAGANGLAVRGGAAAIPGIGLALGFVGAGAVMACGIVLSKTRFAAPIRYCGANSIVIYLAFSLFMAAARMLLLRVDPFGDLGSVALATTAISVIGPLALFWITRETRLSFLFTRPRWARLAPAHVGGVARLARLRENAAATVRLDQSRLGRRLLQGAAARA